MREREGESYISIMDINRISPMEVHKTVAELPFLLKLKAK